VIRGLTLHRDRLGGGGLLAQRSEAVLVVNFEITSAKAEEYSGSDFFSDRIAASVIISTFLRSPDKPAAARSAKKTLALSLLDWLLRGDFDVHRTVLCLFNWLFSTILFGFFISYCKIEHVRACLVWSL
jgi:hypothetical protein